VLWGAGTPRREFLYCDDLAHACLFIMNLDQQSIALLGSSEAAIPLIKIGSVLDQTIRNPPN